LNQLKNQYLNNHVFNSTFLTARYHKSKWDDFAIHQGLQYYFKKNLLEKKDRDFICYAKSQGHKISKNKFSNYELLENNLI